MRDIDNFFLQKEEPAKSCLLALRHLILNYRSDITETWKYNMPFYNIKKSNGAEKRFCYLWVNNKTRLPYIGVVDGNLLEHPDLISEKRSRMKILLIDPNQDLPIEKIKQILEMAIALIDKKLPEAL